LAVRAPKVHLPLRSRSLAALRVSVHPVRARGADGARAGGRVGQVLAETVQKGDPQDAEAGAEVASKREIRTPKGTRCAPACGVCVAALTAGGRRGWQAEKDRKKRTSDPFYLGAKANAPEEAPALIDEEEVAEIPIFHLEEDSGKKKKKGRRKVASDSESDDADAGGDAPVVFSGYEMPDGEDSDDGADAGASKDAVSSALDVDLNRPLKADEVLPTLKAYERKSRYEVEEDERKRRRKEKKEKKERRKEGEDAADGVVEEDGEGEKGRKEGKKSKKDKSKKGETADLLDMGGDAAPAEAEEPPKREKAKEVDDLDDFFSSPPSKPAPESDVAVNGAEKEGKKSKKKIKDREEEEEEEDEGRKGKKKSKDKASPAPVTDSTDREL
jgi:hypothetical protein